MDMQMLDLNPEALPFIYGLMLAVYGYFGHCLYTLAAKLGLKKKAWMAWLPVANLLLLCDLSNRPRYWAIILIAPLLLSPNNIGVTVTTFVSVLLWSEIAVRRGKPSWLGLFLFLPVLNLLVMGYISFVDGWKLNRAQ